MIGPYELIVSLKPIFTDRQNPVVYSDPYAASPFWIVTASVLPLPPRKQPVV